MTRPTFQIDQKRLCALRNEKGFTQLKLAKEVSKCLGKEDTQSEETLISNYQRIERSGKTSKERARALAIVLDVSVELLQGFEGPEPLDYRQNITTLLKKEIENGANTALQHALARKEEDGIDDALSCLSQEIGERIEAVQLGRNPSEIAKLIALTGLPESELLKPANMLGHWFVTVTSQGCNRSDIIHGVTDVCYHVQKIISDRLDHFGSDNFIRLWRDDNWFRIEIGRPRRTRLDLMRIDFVRCRADAKGLFWSTPSWQDEFWIKELFVKKWAYSAANMVTNFEGTQSPSDLQRLRLVVTEHEGSYETICRRMIVSGHLDEILDECRINCQTEGTLHSLYMSWLVADLRRALMPRLAEFPSACWHIGTHDCIDIALTPPRSSTNIIAGVRYRIKLIEEFAANEFTSVPWRQKDKEALGKEIEGWVQETFETADEGDSISKFDPI
ncbi:MAG: helix-turn-helix domain-containing protein [Burkholderiales bacterium]